MPPTPPSVHHIFSRPISDGAVHMRHRGTRRVRRPSAGGNPPVMRTNATATTHRTRSETQTSALNARRIPTRERAQNRKAAELLSRAHQPPPVPGAPPHSRAPCFRRKENLQKHRFSRRLATSETAKLEWLALIKYCYCPTCGSAHVIGRRVFIRARVQYLYYCTDQF